MQPLPDGKLGNSWFKIMDRKIMDHNSGPTYQIEPEQYTTGRAEKTDRSNPLILLLSYTYDYSTSTI